MHGLSHLPAGSTLEALTLSTIILILAVAIIVANLIVVATYLNFKGPHEVINYYLLSLGVADLLCGLFIVPLYVYPAFAGEWVYGDVLCRIVGYLEVTLWSISVYTFMWISVDRYLAVRKPLRYETIQTKTRVTGVGGFNNKKYNIGDALVMDIVDLCQCWMAFTWISAAMLCCPPLLGYNEARYNKETHICMLEWGNMAAYSATLAILVLGPSVISIVYNYGYIFTMMRKVRSGAPIHDKEYATALAENLANPSHCMSFALVFSFWISWGPYIVLRIYELVMREPYDHPMIQFGAVWLGILNSFWKIIIMTSMSQQFRLLVRLLFLTICCKTKGRLQAELIGLDPDD